MIYDKVYKWKSRYWRMEFPRDNFPHKSVIEWWYFNGNLVDKRGKEYAFMNCLFKADPKKSGIPIVKKIPAREIYFSHSIFSELAKKKTRIRTHPLSILSNDSLKEKNFFVNYLNPSSEGYVNNEIIEIGKGKWKIKNDDLELVLTSKKGPFLHNGKGEFDVKGKKAFYYSFTDMNAKGVVKINGKNIEVEGKVWMDHEWAGFVGVKNWNWFSIQLNDGVEIIIQDYNNRENLYCGISYSYGKQEFLYNFSLEEREKWRSRVTGASYPIEWKIKIPSRNIDLRVKAPIPNQEVLFGTLNYWEGPIRVSGKIGKKKVKGKGFMEITGRKMKKSSMQIYNYELRKEAAYYLKMAEKEAKVLWKNEFGK